MNENQFQAQVIRELRELLPGCIVLKNDANYMQGIPDLIILFEDRWAMLEVKKALKARSQPNQGYYLRLLDNMSFASLISPENKEGVLVDLQFALKTGRPTRISKRL